MDFFDVALERFSYRGMYLPTPVPRDNLRKIMEVGLAAPSGCNKQTTSLIGIDDESLIKSIGTLLNKPHFASTPAAICVLTQPIIAYGNSRFNVQDYSAAIQNMLLAITALGYASCWVEGYITDATDVGSKMAALLHVPDKYQLVAYLPVGIPAQSAKRVERKAFEQRAAFNGFEDTIC